MMVSCVLFTAAQVRGSSSLEGIHVQGWLAVARLQYCC